MSKVVALLFVMLMMVGTIGMFISVLLKPSDKVEIPGSRLITYRLTEVQLKEIIKNYYTNVEYVYPSGCMECGVILNSLEYWTAMSDNQIYLQEVQDDSSSSSKLTVTSLRGQEILHNPNEDEIKNDICDMLIDRSLFCLEINISENQNVTNSVNDTNTTS